MVNTQKTPIVVAAIAVGAILLVLGIKLGEQTIEPVAPWIKLVMMPGTFAALVFPGIHSDGFIRALVFFNLLIYETPFIVMFCRKHNKGNQ